MNSDDRIRFSNLIDGWRESAGKYRTHAANSPKVMDKRNLYSIANTFERCAEEAEVTVKAGKRKAAR